MSDSVVVEYFAGGSDAVIVNVQGYRNAERVGYAPVTEAIGSISRLLSVDVGLFKDDDDGAPQIETVLFDSWDEAGISTAFDWDLTLVIVDRFVKAVTSSGFTVSGIAPTVGCSDDVTPDAEWARRIVTNTEPDADRAYASLFFWTKQRVQTNGLDMFSLSKACHPHILFECVDGSLHSKFGRLEALAELFTWFEAQPHTEWHDAIERWFAHMLKGLDA